jgi:hypothetical protein
MLLGELIHGVKELVQVYPIGRLSGMPSMTMVNKHKSTDETMVSKQLCKEWVGSLVKWDHRSQSNTTG